MGKYRDIYAVPNKESEPTAPMPIDKDDAKCKACGTPLMPFERQMSAGLCAGCIGVNVGAFGPDAQDDATIEEAMRLAHSCPEILGARDALALCDIATRRGEERDRALGYVEKLKLDISGHKGVIGQQYDHIAQLQSERDALAEEIKRLREMSKLCSIPDCHVEVTHIHGTAGMVGPGTAAPIPNMIGAWVKSATSERLGGGAVLHERQLYVYPRGPGDAPGNQWVCSCGGPWPCVFSRGSGDRPAVPNAEREMSEPIGKSYEECYRQAAFNLENLCNALELILKPDPDGRKAQADKAEAFEALRHGRAALAELPPSTVYPR